MQKQENPENPHEKTPAKTEKIDVGKLEADADVSEMTSGVSADLMKTVDSAESLDEGGESFSEQKGQKLGDHSGSKNGLSNSQDLKAHILKTVSTKKMKKAVAASIRKEIRKEEKKVLLAYAGLKKYPPYRLAEMLAKIRSLRDLLTSLVDATKEILMGLYLKWVRKET